LGGCPYAKGATGNVPTEDVVFLASILGIEHGIDLEKLLDTGNFIAKALGRENYTVVKKEDIANIESYRKQLLE